jgi:predicted amidohydrolase
MSLREKARQSEDEGKREGIKGKGTEIKIGVGFCFDLYPFPVFIQETYGQQVLSGR